MKKENKAIIEETKPVLSKTSGWIILVILVILGLSAN